MARDRALLEAIRRHLRRALEAADTSDIDQRRRKRKLEELAERRRKLLELHYAGRVSAELFAEKESKITREIEALRQEQEQRIAEKGRLSEVAERFEEVARILREMDLDEIWREATDEERRVLVEELLDAVAIFPEHLEVRTCRYYGITRQAYYTWFRRYEESGQSDQNCDQHPTSATIRVHMEEKQVGVRELRQNLSRYLRRVARGERLEVTERGRPVALLGPIGESESPLRRLVASGRVRPPQGDLLDLAPPKGRVSTKGTEALQELREDRG